MGDGHRDRPRTRAAPGAGAAAGPLPVAAEDALPWPTQRSDAGEVATFETRLPADARHGCWSVGEIARRDFRGLDLLALGAGLSPFTLAQTVFLDVEATSLSAGTGNLAFLTGVGVFVESTFVVRQILMTTPLAEPEYLDAVDRELRGLRRIVTFFGKAYDRHRLLDRARCQRRELRLPREHFDLYWLSRRLAKGRFPDLKLQTLERRCLQFERRGDLPGSEAPEMYFRYLRGAGDAGLVAVLRHNFYDVLSLAALAAELALRVEAPTEPRERLCRARQLAEGGQTAAALVDLERGGARAASARELLQIAARFGALRDHGAQARALDLGLQRFPRCAELWLAQARSLWRRTRAAAGARRSAERAVELAGAGPVAAQARRVLQRLETSARAPREVQSAEERRRR